MRVRVFGSLAYWLLRVRALFMYDSGHVVGSNSIGIDRYPVPQACSRGCLMYVSK